jgi:hypothetical protein
MPKAKAVAKARRKARKARLRRQLRPAIGDAGLQELVRTTAPGEAPWLAKKRAAQRRRTALLEERRAA